MAQQTINNGDAGVDARSKINTNFLELYTGKIGTATAQTNVTWTVNSNGISLNGSGYAGTATALNLTNLTGTLSANSAGISLSMSAGAGGASPAASAANGSFSFQTVSFSNLNGISFGTSAGSAITASHNALTTARASNDAVGLNTAQTNVTWTVNSAGISFNAGGYAGTGTSATNASITLDTNGLAISVAAPGGGYTLSTYDPYLAAGRSTVLVGVPTGTSAGVSVYPFWVDNNVSAGAMNMAYSMAFLTVGTSSGRQTMGLAMGIYSLNVSTLSSIVSTSFSIGVTGNNSSYTINQPTSTAFTGFAAADTNSAGSNISSGYTGVKMVAWPINTLLTPGNYWLAMIGTNSTSSVNVGVSMSHMGAAMATFGSAMAPIGSFSTSYSTGFDRRGGRWNIMQGSWTSAGSVTMIPASMAHNSISAVGLTYPLIKFWST